MQAPPSRKDGVAAKALSKKILAKIEKILAKIQAILAKISTQYFLAPLKGKRRSCLPKPQRPCSKKPRPPAFFAYIPPHRQVWPCPTNPFSRAFGDKDGTRLELRKKRTTIKARKGKHCGKSRLRVRQDKANLATKEKGNKGENNQDLKQTQRATKEVTFLRHQGYNTSHGAQAKTSNRWPFAEN
jgi:hypothetical protein